MPPYFARCQSVACFEPLGMAMSYPQLRAVFRVWPCSHSNGTGLELGCAKVGLSLVLSAGE